jgi:hypothetical protein
MTGILAALLALAGLYLWLYYRPCQTVPPVVDYYDYIRSAEWRERAIDCKQTANQICADCKQKYELWELQAHHVTYERLGNERPGDLVCLCDGCHKGRHGID